VYRQDCSMRSFKKTTRRVCIFYSSSVNYQFTSISKISISLGVRPLDPYFVFALDSPLRQSIPQSYRAVDATASLDPSHSLPFPLLPFPFLYHLPFLSLRSRPIQLGSLWERCKLPQWGLHSAVVVVSRV